MSEATTLKKSLGLPLLVFYGLGTIVGAGIYVLIGEVAGRAGAGSAHAFLFAGIIAAFTGCSYAELSARFPRSAGAALYVFKASKSRRLFQIVGWFIVLTGVVSAAAIANGFVGYFQIFFAMPDMLITTALIIFLAGIAAWGIDESAWLITIITLLEVGGLFLVMILGQSDNAALNWHEILWQPLFTVPSSIFIGSFLAFYAFIGFEDMVNIVEEAKHPTRDLPIAIIASLILATLMYVVVSIFALRQIGPAALAASNAPMAEIVIRGGHSPAFISLISLVAVVNGALVQIIMASRVLYGMASQKIAPPLFAKIHPKTQTPVAGTVFCALIVLGLALWLPISTLAQMTSLIMLCIFTLVNISLIIIKQRHEPTTGISFPIYIPGIAALLCVALLVARLLQI